MIGEKAPELGQPGGPKGPDWLLDHVVEQLLDEGVVGLFAVGEEGCELPGTNVLGDLAAGRLVEPVGVDRLASLIGAEAADGVEVFEAEAEGVDHPVAGDAGRWAGVKRPPFPSGQ